MKTIDDWVAYGMVTKQELNVAADDTGLNQKQVESVAAYLVPRVAVHVLTNVADAYRRFGQQQRDLGLVDPGNQVIASQLYDEAMSILADLG